MTTEIPLKRWIIEEAERLRISPRSFEARFYRGQVTLPAMRRENTRVVYVVTQCNQATVATTG